MTFTHANALNNYGPAKFIVATSAANGTHTTLASAMAVASVGDTIFLRDSVTENVTITPGVNITAWNGGSLNTPSITGTLTMTGAGTSTLNGLTLITNSAALIAVTGSAASILNVSNCYLNCSNNTGITLSSSGVGSGINLFNCNGDLGTTGIAYFTQSSNGSIIIQGGIYTNTGSSTTASVMAGSANFEFINTDFQNILSQTTNTSNIIIKNSLINITRFTLSSVINGVGLSLAGSSGNIFASNSSIGGGTSSAVSIGTGTTGNFYNCIINSSNTNAITGAGSILYSGISFSGTSNIINTTTQTLTGTLQGSKNTTPTAGFLGERISTSAQNIAAGSTGNGKTITSINLTPGVWDISTIATATTGSINMSLIQVGISTTTNTFEGNNGDQNLLFQSSTGIFSFLSGDIPAFRVVISATTTYYCVVRVDYATGAPTVSARISGVRVG